MKVQQIFFKNTLRNFSYLITFDDDSIYCIDPFNGQEVLSFLGEKKLSSIINTHDHCDHHSGNEELVKKFNCQVLGHEKAIIPFMTKGLRDGEIIHECKEWTLRALDTPGHTFSHLCVQLEKNAEPYALFTGDCFFNAGVGNCHSGDVHLLYQSISEVFFALPDDLLIYPGHEYLKRNLEFTASIESGNKNAQDFLERIKEINLDEVFFINSMKVERNINTFLRLREPEIITHLGLSGRSDENIFIKLRELRNKW